MRRKFRTPFPHFRERLCAAGIALFFIASSTAQGQSAHKSWLDRPLRNWNRPQAKISSAPPGGLDGSPDICRDSIRKPTGPEDRAVTAAGWLLVGSLQRLSGTALVLAESSADGMCRPMGFQEFVFVGGRFAGTISPVPMNSREDGAMNPIELHRADRLNAAFSRYAQSDARCCPSRQTLVSYEIKTVDGRPLLVPLSLHTSDLPRN
jgi:LppP/LprE lipoprotein